jgi:hypothetical protein
MGNDNWRALMGEEEVGCEDFEPINLCKLCRKSCDKKLPEVRVVDCEEYEPVKTN